MFKRLMPALMAASAALLCTAAPAQDFPNRPLRIMVPWAPGGNVDITARTLQPRVQARENAVNSAAGSGAPAR